MPFSVMMSLETKSNILEIFYLRKEILFFNDKNGAPQRDKFQCLFCFCTVCSVSVGFTFHIAN